MYKIVILLFSLFIFTKLSAQENILPPYKKPYNSVFVNLLGDASLVSINYERLVKISDFAYLSGKIGLGFNQEIVLFNSKKADVYTTLPHHLTLNFGKTNHFLELGMGGTPFLGNTTVNILYYPILGYRVLPSRTKKLNLRIYGQLPLVDYNELNFIFFPVGASVGYCF